MPTGVYPRPTDAERLLRRVVADGECWLWTGGRSPNGYGRAWYRGRVINAHRAVYQAFCGPVDRRLELDHLCRRTSCVNPAHLEPVSGAENRRRQAAAKPRVTACRHGHAYTPENTTWLKGRWKVCRTCMRTRYHARRRAAA